MKKLNCLLSMSAALLLAPAISKAEKKNVERPNIIWITCEDISPFMTSYDADVVKTPNISQLAREGVQFQSMYTTAGVSAPSRSCIIDRRAHV